MPLKEALAFGEMGLWVPRERKLALAWGGVFPLLAVAPPAAMPLASFMALGTVCPTWGGSFRGSLGSSNLGGEEGLGTRQWAWAPFINRKLWFSGLVASPSVANLSAPPAFEPRRGTSGERVPLPGLPGQRGFLLG